MSLRRVPSAGKFGPPRDREIDVSITQKRQPVDCAGSLAYRGVVGNSGEYRPAVNMAARVGVVLGGMVCLAITPAFASAYYVAYGRSEGESAPPDWLSSLDSPWFSAGPIATYKRHGIVFGLALLVVVVSLALVVRPRHGKGRLEQRAWLMIIAGLGAVALGSLSEYGIPEDVVDPSNGFGLELLGFLVVAAGSVTLGWADHREHNSGAIRSVGVALFGLVAIVAGTALIEHLPSGPASILIVASVVIAATGYRATSRSHLLVGLDD
jgi:hypothetical protein